MNHIEFAQFRWGSNTLPQVNRVGFFFCGISAHMLGCFTILLVVWFVWAFCSLRGHCLWQYHFARLPSQMCPYVCSQMTIRCCQLVGFLCYFCIFEISICYESIPYPIWLYSLSVHISAIAPPQDSGVTSKLAYSLLLSCLCSTNNFHAYWWSIVSQNSSRLIKSVVLLAVPIRPTKVNYTCMFV